MMLVENQAELFDGSFPKVFHSFALLFLFWSISLKGCFYKIFKIDIDWSYVFSGLNLKSFIHQIGVFRILSIEILYFVPLSSFSY